MCLFIMLNQQRNGDYYENPSLSNLRDNFNSKENGRKKSFSYKTKASKPCIPMKRNVYVPNYKKNEGYDMNPSLSYLVDEL